MPAPCGGPATYRLIARMEDRALLTRDLCETDHRDIYANATFA